MDIKIDLKISSPELMASILALAEALQDLKPGFVYPTVKEQSLEVKAPETVEKVEEKKAAQEKEKIRIETVRAKLSELSKLGRQADVKALIKKYGGNKLPEVSEEHYEAIIAEVEALIN